MHHHFTRNLFVAPAILATILSLHAQADTTVSSETPFGAVYTDEHPGSAGLPQYTHGNSYYFDITKASGRAIVLVEASRAGDDTKGDVLIFAGGKTILLGSWNKQKIPKEGLRFDASKHISKPGKYEIRFDWRGGAWGLETSKVTVDTRK